MASVYIWMPQQTSLPTLVSCIYSNFKGSDGNRPHWPTTVTALLLHCCFLHWSNWDYGLTFKFSTPHLVPAYSEYMFGVGLCFSAYSVQWLKTKVVGVGVCVNFIIIINCFSKFWQPIWWFAAARAHHSTQLDLCNPSQSTKNNLLEGDQSLFCQSIQ